MERHKISSSQLSIDKKTNLFKDSSMISINKQNQLQTEIDYFIQHGILEPIVEYDPKINFKCVSIVNRDHIIKQTRRQTCGLIWKSIRSSLISKLVHDDRSCAFVEILGIPKEWSRYDADILLVKIRQRNFLNGLALRDEFVRILKIIIKRDLNEYSFELKDIEFTRNTIQLVFNYRQDPEITIIISLILLVEFDVPCSEFFPDTFTSLCYHNDLNDYFKYHQDFNRTRLTPYNSIKFLFDYSLTEANLCEYLSQNSNSLSLMLNNFLKLRKEWLKYVQRAAKYATETIRMQIHPDKHRQSVSSINSMRSIASNASTMNKLMQNKLPLTTEIEVAFEFLFSISLLRLLFLTICSQYKQFGTEHDNDIAFAIEKALKLLGDGLENNYLEHPFFKNTNILPDSLSTHEINIKVAIKKIVAEMQRDWKRNIRR